MRFLILNGKIQEKGDVVLPEAFINNQLSFSHKIWYGFGGIPLFQENINLLKKQAAALKIPFPAAFGNERELLRLIKRMLNKNRFYRSGHLHLQVFYLPDAIHTLVSSTNFSTFTFPFSEDGVLAAFSTQKKHAPNSMNRLPLFNERLWQLALTETAGTACRQTVILNEKDQVCECAFSSLYVISENVLKTPSCLTGCHDNALHQVVIEAAKRVGLKTDDAAIISTDQLFEADEIFCASEAYGIQWLLGIEQQRFIHYYSEKIAEELNVLLKLKAVNQPL